MSGSDIKNSGLKIATEASPEKDFIAIEDKISLLNHEERLEWVKQSCERFFEKVRENDALMNLVELN